MKDELSGLIDQLADKSARNRAIVQLVGAINANDLRRVSVEPRVKQALIAGLDHSNPRVRWWCLQLMDHLADESYLVPILTRLSDPVGKVRRHAVHALSCGLCKPNRCTLKIDIEGPLRQLAASDPDERVRTEAREALLRLGYLMRVDS
jgi:HEAT repeat protein